LSESADYDLKRCAKCGAWIPSTATMCAYCNTSSPDAPAARPRGPALSLRHGFSVTNALVVANLVYFVLSLIVQSTWTPGGNLLQWALTGTGLTTGLDLAGAYYHDSFTEDGEWWRVLAANFLHIGGIHLALNMLALKQLGPLAEALFGPARFLTVYVVSGAVSSLAISVWYAGVLGQTAAEIHPVAGASGAIFGVAGLLTVYLLRAGTERGRAIAMSLGRSVLLMLAIGLVVPMISQVGHVGGLLPGALFGLLLRGQFTDRLDSRARAAWDRVAAFCILAVVASLGFGAWNALTHLGGN
jgi:membrane associated rhomboid family serine protease